MVWRRVEPCIDPESEGEGYTVNYGSNGITVEVCRGTPQPTGRVASSVWYRVVGGTVRVGTGEAVNIDFLSRLATILERRLAIRAVLEHTNGACIVETVSGKSTQVAVHCSVNDYSGFGNPVSSSIERLEEVKIVPTALTLGVYVLSDDTVHTARLWRSTRITIHSRKSIEASVDTLLELRDSLLSASIDANSKGARIIQDAVNCLLPLVILVV